MDIVVVFNGLGNQMSQYAFYLNKKSINKSSYIIDYCTTDSHNGFELNSVFNIGFKKRRIEKVLLTLFKLLLIDKYRIITRPVKYLLKNIDCRIVFENFDYNFKPEYLLPSKRTTFYYGGWHSEKYFISSEAVIRETFSFPEIDASDYLNLEHIRFIKNSNSVAIHVRRGDYLTDNNMSLFGGVCTLKYFENAIALINTIVEEPHYFVFSNDIAWVKENLKLRNVTYITNNYGSNSWKDMFLMSICKHNIISNSSFSWWGAWLNINPDKTVICPSKYLVTDKRTDFYPESWKKIDDI